MAERTRVAVFVGGYSSSSSIGAPLMLCGWRKLLPVNRRMVARSTRRSTVATAVASEGKRLRHLENPVLAVRTMEPCRWRGETRRIEQEWRFDVASES